MCKMLISFLKLQISRHSKTFYHLIDKNSPKSCGFNSTGLHPTKKNKSKKNPLKTLIYRLNRPIITIVFTNRQLMIYQEDFPKAIHQKESLNRKF